MLTKIMICQNIYFLSIFSLGGNVLFDEADITLNSEYILITDQGLLQVGTEEEPFQHKGTIMLHGHVRSKELPIYGAKVLAVRNGTLELHGEILHKHVAIEYTIGFMYKDCICTSMTHKTILGHPLCPNTD